MADEKEEVIVLTERNTKAELLDVVGQSTKAEILDMLAGASTEAEHQAVLDLTVGSVQNLLGGRDFQAELGVVLKELAETRARLQAAVDELRMLKGQNTPLRPVGDLS